MAGMNFEEYVNAYYGGTLGIAKRYGIEKADNDFTVANQAAAFNVVYGAKVYNQFYHDVSILKSSESSRGFRLHLTQLTAETIKKSMSLIGIGVPERM